MAKLKCVVFLPGSKSSKLFWQQFSLSIFCCIHFWQRRDWWKSWIVNVLQRYPPFLRLQCMLWKWYKERSWYWSTCYLPWLMPLLGAPKIEGLQVLCVEDQQILPLHLIFYATSKKTSGIHSIGYWVCILVQQSLVASSALVDHCPNTMFLPSTINHQPCFVYHMSHSRSVILKRGCQPSAIGLY